MDAMTEAAGMGVTVEDDYPELRESVAKLCADFPDTYWRNLEDQPPGASYPTEFIQALTAAGYLAALIPEEFGGAGLPIRAGAVILETIQSTGCSASAGHAQMYTMGTVLRHGSEEQKRKYLPEIAAGRLRLQAFAVTEPTTGSDTTQLKTRAEKKGNGYVVNGQKVWISRAAHSDLMLLLARTTPAAEAKSRADGVSVFLIDLRELKGNGVDIRPIDAMVNHNTTEVFFEDAFIPADSLIGEEGKGFKYILSGMNAERCLVSAEAIGNGKLFVRKAVHYVNERVVFGKPIGSYQGVQFPIAQAYMQLQAADLMVRKATALFDAGKPCGAEANMGKMLSGEAVWACAEACFQAFGGFAFAREYGVERKWREARLSRNAPIHPNMILNFIAQHVLGLPRSY